MSYVSETLNESWMYKRVKDTTEVLILFVLTMNIKMSFTVCLLIW